MSKSASKQLTYPKAFGPTLGPLYTVLDDEVAWLNQKWLEFQSLYTKGQKRVDVLNETAPHFFCMIQEVLRDDILLHIARLVENSKDGSNNRNTNLTFPILKGKISDESLGKEVNRLIDKAIEEAEFAVSWRNKRLAHIDYSHALRKVAQLQDIDEGQIATVLKTFGSILNLLQVHFLDTPTAYEHSISPYDAEALLSCLAVAAEYFERRRTKLNTGKPLPAEWEILPEF